MIGTSTQPQRTHLLALAKFLAVTCFSYVSSIAFASNACPRLPCTSVAECREIASWAIEGTVLDAIGDKPGKACMPSGGPLICESNSSGGTSCQAESYCAFTAPQPMLVLENVTVLKGSLSIVSKDMRALVHRAALCYSHQISSPVPSFPGVDLTLIQRVPPIGARVRAYGHMGGKVGYYYFVEFADPELLGCAANSPMFQCIPTKR